MADLTQRLNQYQKRLARHTQIKMARDRAGLPVNRRTLAAIENNAMWVNHFRQLITFEDQIARISPDLGQKETSNNRTTYQSVFGLNDFSLKADAQREKGKVLNAPDHLQRASVEVSHN